MRDWVKGTTNGTFLGWLCFILIFMFKKFDRVLACKSNICTIVK
jgi:hypothetical protein